MLGGEVLPEASVCHGLRLVGDIEENAFAMRRYLRISEFGPVGNLIGILENKGILVYVSDIDNDAFSGMNGMVNGRPFIVVKTIADSGRGTDTFYAVSVPGSQ